MSEKQFCLGCDAPLQDSDFDSEGVYTCKNCELTCSTPRIHPPSESYAIIRLSSLDVSLLIQAMSVYEHCLVETAPAPIRKLRAALEQAQKAIEDSLLDQAKKDRGEA